MRTIFNPLYLARSVGSAPLGDKGIQAVIKGATKAEPFWEEKMTMPIARFIPWLGTKIQWLQQGDFRVYCVYFVIALVAILLSLR